MKPADTRRSTEAHKSFDSETFDLRQCRLFIIDLTLSLIVL